MRIYQLYASTTASTTLQIVGNGTLVAVTWSAYIGSTSTGDGLICELSQQGTIQNTTNNPVGIYSVFRHSILSATAASVMQSGLNFFHSSLSFPVKVGDMVYLNTILAGTGSTVRCLLHVA